MADTGYKPLRIKVASAAKLLDLKLEAVRDLIHDGTFTAIAPNGRGRGRRLYLIPAEVEAYATGGREAVEKLRAKRGRK